MASSGTYNFAVSNGEAVLAALERLQIRGPSVRQEHMITARRETNLMLAEWSNKQVNLWKVELLSEPLSNGEQTINVPGRVVLVLDAWIRSTSGGSTADLIITPISRTQWASFASKLDPGRPTTYWFDRQIAPTMTLWPVPNQSGIWTLFYYAVVQVQDANLAGGETPDIPYLWLDAYIAGLAHRLSRTYAPQLEDKRKTDAMEAWAVAATQNTEAVNLVIAPPVGAYYRR